MSDDKKQETPSILNDEAQNDEAQISEENPTSGGNDNNQLELEIKRLQDALARSQADYQNYVMRVERDKVDMMQYLSAKMILPLLAQVDNLERAVKLKEGVEGDTFVDGIRSMLQSFEKYLESQGVKSFLSLGQEVDPDRHEVMTEMSGEAGKIVQEFEKGYTLAGKVIRHAKVVVGNGN